MERRGEDGKRERHLSPVGKGGSRITVVIKKVFLGSQSIPVSQGKRKNERGKHSPLGESIGRTPISTDKPTRSEERAGQQVFREKGRGLARKTQYRTKRHLTLSRHVEAEVPLR